MYSIKYFTLRTYRTIEVLGTNSSFSLRLPSWGYHDWNQFLEGGSSRWWLWHQCSNHILHVQWTPGVPQGQPADRLGVCQPAHLTGADRHSATCYFRRLSHTVCNTCGYKCLNNPCNFSYVFLCKDDWMYLANQASGSLQSSTGTEALQGNCVIS